MIAIKWQAREKGGFNIRGRVNSLASMEVRGGRNISQPFLLPSSSVRGDVVGVRLGIAPNRLGSCT